MTAQPVDERMPAAVIEDLTFLAEHGVGITAAAARTGFTNAKTLDKWMRRHGAVPVLNQLTRQEPLPIGDHGPDRHLRRAS